MLSSNELRRVVVEARAFFKPLLRATLDANPVFWEQWVCTPLDKIIDIHMVPEHRLENVTREDILSGLLMSAQNRQGANNVISGCLTGGWQDLGTMLHGFDADAILETWETPDELFAFFQQEHKVGRIKGQMPDTNHSLWPIFCKSVLSAARLVVRFPTAEEFVDWLNSFRQTPDTAAALPLVLAQEIDGFGVALACDFLKELGCTEFPKPDTHVNKLARELGISTAKSDYGLMRDICRAADSIGMTAYEFDKVLWLIGSGRFYQVMVNSHELTIGRQADNFLAHMETIPWRDH